VGAGGYPGDEFEGGSKEGIRQSPGLSRDGYKWRRSRESHWFKKTMMTFSVDPIYNLFWTRVYESVN